MTDSIHSNNFNLTDESIYKLMKRYSKHKECCKKYMKRRYHEDDAFKEHIQMKSRNYYNNNKDQKRAYYDRVKPRILAQKRWKYAVASQTTERFIFKYPEDFKTYIEPVSLFSENNISNNNIDEVEATTDN
tara:strand:+ start:1371 stop:1763 length:393 start_codon:yes stop_codon:yes gene_type:complete